MLSRKVVRIHCAKATDCMVMKLVLHYYNSYITPELKITPKAVLIGTITESNEPILHSTNVLLKLVSQTSYIRAL